MTSIEWGLLFLSQKKNEYKNRSEDKIEPHLFIRSSIFTFLSLGSMGDTSIFIINSVLAEASVPYNLEQKESKMEFSYTKFGALFTRQSANNHHCSSNTPFSHFYAFTLWS